MSLRTVQVWVARAGSERLDRVDWNDRPRGGRRAAQATSSSVEDLILEVRRRLKTSSALREFGAVAIRRELTDHPRKYPLKKVPALRTSVFGVQKCFGVQKEDAYQPATGDARRPRNDAAAFSV